MRRLLLTALALSACQAPDPVAAPDEDEAPWGQGEAPRATTSVGRAAEGACEGGGTAQLADADEAWSWWAATVPDIAWHTAFTRVVETEAENLEYYGAELDCMEWSSDDSGFELTAEPGCTSFDGTLFEGHVATRDGDDGLWEAAYEDFVFAYGPQRFEYDGHVYHLQEDDQLYFGEDLRSWIESTGDGGPTVIDLDGMPNRLVRIEHSSEARFFEAENDDAWDHGLGQTTTLDELGAPSEHACIAIEDGPTATIIAVQGASLWELVALEGEDCTAAYVDGVVQEPDCD